MEKIKVIYIASQGRSGSTVIDRILGTLDGVASMAEIYRVFIDGFADQKLCTCGSSILECPFWSEIISCIFNKIPDDIYKYLSFQNAVDHSQYFYKLFRKNYDDSFKEKLDSYKDFLQSFYRKISDQTGCKIIIDSSKLPSHALILSEIQDIDVYVVHIVRDVRAVINSWQSDKYDPSSGSLMKKISSRKTVMAWIYRNIMCEALSLKLPYYRIIYEDFVESPKTVLQNLVDQIEPISGKILPFIDDFSIELPFSHTIGGNPDRFQSGLTHIYPDHRWTKDLSLETNLFANIFSFPLLARYGFYGKIYR